MKSNQRFSNKWKWILIGTSVGIITIGGMSLGIALASENKTLKSTSSYFNGENSINLMYKSLNKMGYNSLPNPNNQQAWIDLAKKNSFTMTIYNGTNLLEQETDPLFSTYQINKNSLSNLYNKNLIKNTISNLDSLAGNKLTLNYYTLDNAPFFSSKVTLFNDSVINAIDSATNNKINFNLIPRSPTTFNAVYNNQNCELGSMFWSPDYNDVSSWIGYLFVSNSGWVNGNLWPCLWALLSGANPNNGQFTNLPDANTTYSNPSTFSQQLAYTNARRHAMGLGNLPAWAVGLFQNLFYSLNNVVAWNTNYGWWQIQYNNNQIGQTLQYIIQNWVSSVENTQVVVSSSGIEYNQQTNYSQSFYDNLSITNSPVQYTSQSSLIQFIAWIDALVPVMPFYAGGNNLTQYPVLTQKNTYILNNPANEYNNGQYYINLNSYDYSSSNPYVLFLPGSLVSSENDNYFAPVLGAGCFVEYAAGCYSGMMNYVPYNYLQNEKGNKQYSEGYGVTNKPNANLLKLIDSQNFELLDVQRNFIGAHYDNSGINHGDILSINGKNKNANLTFITNPALLLYPNNPQELLSKTQFLNSSYFKNNETWSNYTNYENFIKYHVITLTDGNLASAINNTNAYKFFLNEKINWVNDHGKIVANVESHIEPEDFNNSLAWMAATFSDYSFNSQGQQLGQLQGNSYMLQEIGLAGNNYNLGVGSGFFQTEEYEPNNNPNGDTFTYFLSPSNNVNNTGWNGGAAVSYFLSMLGSQGAYLDPMPSNALAFQNLQGTVHQNWSNITLGQLTKDFMGTNSTNGVWNISVLMQNALNNNNKTEFNKLYQEINKNPAYVTLVANETFNKAAGVLYLYGSGTNPKNGLPEMDPNLLFNGGYYVNANTFTNTSLQTTYIPSFFDNALKTQYGNYILAPASQKIQHLNLQWSSNITKEEELALYLSNQISYDSNVNPSQLENISLTGNQFLYFAGVVANKSSNNVLYNALIYQLTQNNPANFSEPLNTQNKPLVVLDTNPTNNSTTVVNNEKYYAKYGFPYISNNGQILYTDSDKSGLLKSLVKPEYEKVVGTALNPFIYGTTGAEIRQDINAIINWTAIANTSAYPLSQSIILNNVIPYGNFVGNFAYYCPTSSREVILHKFYQYCAATSGIGILGSKLFYTNDNKNNFYYEANLDEFNNSYSQYQWDLINAINDWN